MVARSAAGSVAILATRSPKPLFTSTPILARSAPCFSNTGLKNALTTWPKMIGSETFIIVALRCTEKSTPCAFALATSRSKNATSSFLERNVPSRISPAASLSPSLSTVVAPPSAATNSILAVVAAGIVTDCSLPKKSPLVIDATCALESLLHAPILCGLARA